MAVRGLLFCCVSRVSITSSHRVSEAWCCHSSPERPYVRNCVGAMGGRRAGAPRAERERAQDGGGQSPGALEQEEGHLGTGWGWGSRAHSGAARGSDGKDEGTERGLGREVSAGSRTEPGDSQGIHCTLGGGHALWVRPCQRQQAPRHTEKTFVLPWDLQRWHRRTCRHRRTCHHPV